MDSGTGTGRSEAWTMPVDPNALFETLSNGVEKLPSALIAVALLGGPTAIWLLARFMFPPVPQQLTEPAGEAPMWLCASCRSINEERFEACYRCHRVRAAESVPVLVDRDRYAAIGVGVAVGPGRPNEYPAAPGWLGGEFALPATPAPSPTDPGLPDGADGEESAVPPQPLILKPKVRASGRAQTTPPPKRRARRQPQAPGEPTTKRKSRSPGS